MKEWSGASTLPVSCKAYQTYGTQALDHLVEGPTGRCQGRSPRCWSGSRETRPVRPSSAAVRKVPSIYVIPLAGIGVFEQLRRINVQIDTLAFCTLRASHAEILQPRAVTASAAKNEIDIVAINDLEKRILLVEVKRQLKRYSPQALADKTRHLLHKLDCKGYSVEQECFALDNLETVLDRYAESGAGVRRR